MVPHRPEAHPFLRQYARFGLLSMALIYLMMGGLTARAALGLGGEKADQKDVLPYVLQGPMGRVVLALVGVGLVGYVVWRLLQAWLDPSRLGNRPIGLWFRAGYLVSAAFHAGLAWQALRLAARRGGQDRGDGATRLAEFLMGQPSGPLLVWGVGAILATVGGVQFWRVFSGRYRRRIKDPSLARRHGRLIQVAGTAGYSARGAVLLAAAWLFYRAGLHYRSEEAGGTEGALAFLETLPYGSLLLFATAAGLAVYGVFLGLQAWGLQEDLAG